MSASEGKMTAGRQFKNLAATIATSMLTDWVGEARAKEATGRISVALAASAAAAKDPADFYACTAASVATAIATAALCGLMPGTGAAALAYVIPQRPRKNEPPQLQYMLSHRGLNALARRCGQTMVAVPIGRNDTIALDPSGDVRIVSRDLDDPPTAYDELRGVMVLVRDIATNHVTASQWVPKKLIEQRRAMSRSAKSDYGPWSTWPIEMAMKTAMHYAVSRGWCVIDDTEATRALSAEQESDLLDSPPSGLLEVENTVTGGSKSDRIAAAMASQIPASEPDVDVAALLESWRSRLGSAGSVSAVRALRDEAADRLPQAAFAEFSADCDSCIEMFSHDSVAASVQSR